MAGTPITLFFAPPALSIPVAFAIGIAGPAAVHLQGMLNPLMAMQPVFAGLDSFPLMAAPFFILASERMTARGAMKSLRRFADAPAGHVRGGLGRVNALVSILVAGISGSAPADAAGPGAIVMKMMRGSGYGKSDAGALCAATAAIGPIIPPSILAAIYAISTKGATVAGLFMAGILPGILRGAAPANHVVSTRRGYRGRKARASVAEIRGVAPAAFPAAAMPGIMLGGILGGVFTPTDAGSAASACAPPPGLAQRVFIWERICGAFARAAPPTASAPLIVAMASVFAWLPTVLEIAQDLALMPTSISDDRSTLLLLPAGRPPVCGFFIGALSAPSLPAPVLGPIAAQVGADPLRFGMMLVLNIAIGMIIPRSDRSCSLPPAPGACGSKSAAAAKDLVFTQCRAADLSSPAHAAVLAFEARVEGETVAPVPPAQKDEIRAAARPAARAHLDAESGGGRAEKFDAAVAA